MDIGTFISGLGIGGVVGGVIVAVVKSYLENKQMLAKRIYEERRDAYVNYLQIAAASQTMLPDEAIWVRTAAIERIHLCGSCEVVRLLDIVSNTPPNSPRDTINQLVRAMRADLSF